MSDALDRLRRFCEQVAADGILPSQAWFSETAAELAALAAARLALQQENEQLTARLRGVMDFLSGQPRVLPYRGGETASKESTLNLAWAIGYDGAEDSDAWKLLVSRADRTATRADAALAAARLALHTKNEELTDRAATEQTARDEAQQACRYWEQRALSAEATVDRMCENGGAMATKAAAEISGLRAAEAAGTLLRQQNEELKGALRELLKQSESYVNLSRSRGEDLRPEAADAVRNAMACARDLADRLARLEEVK